MKKQWIQRVKNITFLRLFCLYAAIILFLSFSVFFYQQNQSMADHRLWMERENEQALANVCAYLENLLSNMRISTKQLNDTFWVQQEYVPIHEESLAQRSYLDQLHLAENHLFLTPGDDVFKRICLIMPYRDICIGYRTWVSVSDYLGILKVRKEDRAALTEEIKAVERLASLAPRSESVMDGTLTLCVPLEQGPRSRAYMLFVINRDNLAKELRSRMSGALCQVRLLDRTSGEELFRAQKADAGKLPTVRAAQSAYINWTYEFSFDPAVQTIFTSDPTLRAASFLLLLLACSMALSYLIALYTYLPLGRIVSKVMDGKDARHSGKNAYAILDEAIDALRQRVKDERRYNALHRLLSGLFVEQEAFLAQCEIPFTSALFYQVLLITDTREKENAGDESAFLRAIIQMTREYPQVVLEHVEAEENASILILGYQDAQSARTLGGEICRGLVGCGASVTSGQICQGLIGISISYQGARDANANSPEEFPLQCYFPFAWENQLITNLRAGNDEIVRNICLEIRRENERRQADGKLNDGNIQNLQLMIINDVRRVAAETNRLQILRQQPRRMLRALSATEMWREIDRLCQALCAQLRKAEDEKPAARELLAYIEAHYREHDLCLNALEERFSLSSSTINKLMKDSVDCTFLSYLTDKRLNYAKGLLATGEYTIAQIAEMAGYDNEYSFRRVFQRTMGVKAQDYARTIHADS